MRVIICLLGCLVLSAEAARIEIDRFLAHENAESRTYLLDRPRRIEGILQRNGTDAFVLKNSPRASRWEWSEDGRQWQTVPGTEMKDDGRILRAYRTTQPLVAQHLRVRFENGTAAGEAIFDAEPNRNEIGRWVLIVNSTDDRRLPGHGQEFLPLVRSVPGWEQTRGQQVWVGSVTPELVEAEPKPAAIFFSGSFKDWCEVDRLDWAGVEQVLGRRSGPIWASCGGAQALAILAENGTSQPWDCPHCRDARQPKVPIYTHLGHTVPGKACGDYSGCVFEKGPTNVRVIGTAPIFEGLGGEFKVMESHCGQIAYPPRGWELLATAGAGSLTHVQCVKLKGAPIYAAQFHIEMEGTPESSQRIMKNFLDQAEAWHRSGPMK